MKELLLKRKKGFIKYVVACFLPVVNHFIQMIIFSALFFALEKGSSTYLFKVLGMSAVLSLVGIGLFLLSRMMRIGYMRDILLEIRKNIFSAIINTSYKQFSKKSKESYLSYLTNDINMIETKFFVSLINIIFKGGLYVVSLSILLVLDIKLAIVMGIISASLLGVSRIFANRTVKLQESYSKANEHFTISMSNTFNGLEILKLNQIETQFLNKNLEELKDVETKKCNFNVYTDFQTNVLKFSAYVVIVGVLIYIATLVPGGKSIGYCMFLMMLSNSLIFPLLDLFPLINVVKASANIYNKITGENEKEVLTDAGTLPFKFDEVIEVKDLNFNYDDKVILKNANFCIQKGKKYLIKGPSGAGKSTLLKLLAMVYEDYSGEIKVDGIDYRQIKEKSFNDAVAFIYQDVFLFEDTIKNNITLYQTLSNERIQKAIACSGLQDLIDEKALGIEEKLLENGKNLSGGQRQRISIARAIAKEAHILFIDEGTASLNYELGKQIEETFLTLGSTVIAISHRYYEDVTKGYDYVLEIKNGQIHQYTGKDYFEEEEVKVC